MPLSSSALRVPPQLPVSASRLARSPSCGDASCAPAAVQSATAIAAIANATVSIRRRLQGMSVPEIQNPRQSDAEHGAELLRFRWLTVHAISALTALLGPPPCAPSAAACCARHRRPDRDSAPLWSRALRYARRFDTGRRERES